LRTIVSDLILWQQLLASLQAAKFPFLPIQDTVNLRKYLPSLYNRHETFIIRLIWREAQLHAHWHELKQRTFLPTCRYDLQELLHDVVDLDAEYQAWEDALPSAWSYETQPNTPEARSAYSMKWQKLILTSKGAPAEIHIYSNLKRCSMWGYYRTSRIFLLRDILEILNWMLILPATRPTSPQRSTETSAITSLDDLNLRTLQSSTMTRMISVIEQSCSVILGSFTVPMYKKSSEDVMGIRGHIVLWSLGIMDSVLSSGLVPGSNASRSPLPRVRSAPATIQCGVELDTGLEYFQPDYGQSASAQHSPPTTPPSPTNREHPFDSTPRHPYDVHVPSSDFDAGMRGSNTIDVAAKREWLNCMLYYIGTELGIKKALVVPHAEGYMSIVKPFVDEILGRR
jgi:hypothetical protein